MTRVSESYHTERLGVYAVGSIVHDQFRWIFRPQEGDYGIDAFIEVVCDDVPTGKIIAAQIKSGPSYFNHEDADGIIFRGSLKHLDYWLNHDLPVVVILYDHASASAFWQRVTPPHVTRTPEGWKMSIPRQQRFDATQATQLGEIASSLQRLKDEIQEYRCKHCGAALAERGGEGEYYALHEIFLCGHHTVDGSVSQPCPKDPQFPRFEDYDLVFHPIQSDRENPWFCMANPKTHMARCLHLDSGGRTKEEAERRVREKYDYYAKQ